jgi:hypothetical protein
VSQDLTGRLDPITRLAEAVEALGVRVGRIEEAVAARARETRPMSERVDRILAELVELKAEVRALAAETRERLDAVEATVAGFQEKLGRAGLVVQDAAAYQELLEACERLEAIAGIRRGLESTRRGPGRPADKVFAELRARHRLGDAK